MKIIWLEDDIKTVRNSINQIREKIGVKPVVCENFAEFSDALETLEDREDEVIIIDIRMLFNMENQFSCFEKVFTVEQELDGGFEYYRECISERFERAKVLFFTSKPLQEAKRDAKKYSIDVDMIITKDNLNAMLKVIRSCHEK